MNHLASPTWLKSALRVRSTWRRGMPTAQLRMNLAPEAVWATLVDVQDWPRWGPTVSGAQVEGAGGLTLGTTGTVTTIAGVPLPFEITEFVEHRSWAWKVAGVNATRHEVIAVPGGCVLSFGAPVWAIGYLPVLAVALPRIERIASEKLNKP